MSQPDVTRRKLGRGLSGIIGLDAPVEVPQRTPAVGDRPLAGGPEVRLLPLDAIVPNPFQPRREIDAASLQALADSLKQAGVLQPIVVRQIGDRFQLVAGERRWRAASLAGLTEIPAIVRALSDAESAQLALIENIQREDLNPMDRAFAVRAFMDGFGLGQVEAAERLGLERPTIANLLRLVDLETDIQDLVRSGRLNMGHAKVLAGMGPGPSRVALAKSAASGEWSVRRIEAAAKQVTRGGVGGLEENLPAAPRPAAIVDLERQLGAFLGTKVQVRTDNAAKRGSVTFEFYGLDHFDGIMGKIGFNLK
ncbi:MAG: ParB/RepB/Spo0J family partition protein [Phycisphaerales bacterium]|nr:ParB/RepB/Spo0J family partition protein [Phycisphaerales bacterium]